MAEVDSRANKIKSRAIAIRTASASGPIGRSQVIQFQRDLHDAHTMFTAAAGVTGIAEYYAAQKPGNTVQGSDFTDLTDACAELRDWIGANFPKDVASGAYLIYVYDGEGVPTELTFTTGQLATFRTNCSALEATIS